MSQEEEEEDSCVADGVTVFFRHQRCQRLLVITTTRLIYLLHAACSCSATINNPNFEHTSAAL